MLQGKLPIKACYTVKSHLTRPQTLTAVKVSKQQPPQPCAFDTPLRARTVPGLFGKAGLDGKPPPFWEATMAWTRATPVLKRKLQQLPFSEFAQIYIYIYIYIYIESYRKRNTGQLLGKTVRGLSNTHTKSGRGVCGGKVTGSCYLKEGARNFLKMVTVRDDPSSPWRAVMWKVDPTFGNVRWWGT